MKHLTILVPNGENNLSSIVGSYKIFCRANAYWVEQGRSPVFKIELAGCSGSVDFYEGLFSVHPEIDIHAIERTDLIIVPSLNHHFHSSIDANGDMIEWILHQYKLGSEIAAICTGAFFLGEAGLLNGRSCSTHWAAADEFRMRFPEAKLQPDNLITDEQGIYTNGGAYSFLNLIIYLIEKYYDRETAIYCAKVFQIEPDRNRQSSFAIFSGQKNHDDEVVRQAQELIESRSGERISVEEMSAKFSVGRRNFDRRFIKATGNTPLEYMLRVKVEAAKRAFERTRKTVNEVMYDIGYADPKAFRDAFRKVTGLLPLEYRDRYTGAKK